ncbi:MAG: hypothetical protein Q8S58_03920 [Bosea sp. (in: a-proteobacteria)]|uniref:hypothetical protein n=1 Tax=Bosea sp. (in: a-proteobacteria) TaxID=1871050 RepID=UPI002732E5CB|nr:hypothetical protein [Bosea sp. (in: a-proteobacteria)]MDP3258203.1 hypothetical protein [Bosea sp. (in: a-proteobacteria)]MDP3318257.1 hypothetical protein [Bosea sp. (in: a-proteobacteria)]
MSFSKPFHRNFRGIKDGPNSGYSKWGYILDRDYANNPAHYVRAFLLIQADLIKIFEYVEPSNLAFKAYSFRIHELLMRSCIEVEANFKAILAENIYTPALDRFGKPILNMSVYKKIDKTHRLSSYKVILPVEGSGRIIKPFLPWKNGKSIGWYAAYNASKHDRHDEFKKANLRNLIDAVAGLLVLISSQFYDHDFSAGATGLSVDGYDYHDMSASIGSLFRIEFPDNWKKSELYDFDWSALKQQSNRFEKIDFNVI